MVANTRPVWLKQYDMTADDWSLLVRSVTMCALALLLCGALCATLFFKNYADPTVLVAIIASTNFVLGYLAGKRNQQTDTTTTADPPKIETQQTNA